MNDSQVVAIEYRVDEVYSPLDYSMFTAPRAELILFAAWHGAKLPDTWCSFLAVRLPDTFLVARVPTSGEQVSNAEDRSVASVTAREVRVFCQRSPPCASAR